MKQASALLIHPDREASSRVTPGAPGDEDYMLSLARGLRVIRAFSEYRQFLSVADCARITGLSRPAARRCLYTLTVLGYAGQSHGTYHLTPDVLRLGEFIMPMNRMIADSGPVLAHLSRQAHACCAVALLHGDHVVCIASEGEGPRPGEFGVGVRTPALGTSLGRPLIAELDAKSLARALRRWKPTARSGIVPRKEAIQAELERVKAQGYSFVTDGGEEGVSSLSVPVMSSGRAVATVGVVVRTARDRDAIQRQLLPIARSAAERLATAFTAADAR